MTISNGDIIQAVTEYDLADNSKSQNIFTYIYQGLTDQLDADVLTAIMASLDNLYTDLGPHIYNGCVVNPTLFSIIEWQVLVQKWVKTRDLGFRVPTWVPGATSEQLPNQMAAVLTGSTLVPLSRGRKFFGGFDEGASVAGELTATALAALAAAGVDYLAQLPLGGGDLLKPVVASVAQGGPLTLQAVEANSILGTQRRRKPGVGI